MLELFRDGRSSNTAIAKKLDLSVITVAKKIDALMRDGIITIKAVVNPVKMGNHAGALICLNVDIRKIDTICAELKNVPNIHIMVTAFGRFDLLLITFFRDMEALETFTKNRLKHIDGIRSVSTFLISDIKMGGDVSFNKMSGEDNKANLDAMDMKLISELMQNGRPEYSELAEIIDTSKSTISRRISSLIDEDILKIVAIPNSNLEYLSDAFILINAEYSKIDDICARLMSYPETHLLLKLINDYDILLTMQSISREELYNFIIDKVVCIDGVLKSETFLLASFLHFSTHAMLVHLAE